MLLVLAFPVFQPVSSLHRYLAVNAPSNILIRRVRTSTPGWRPAAALAALAVGLVLVLRVIEIAIGAGGPGWLNVVALVLGWHAIKFAILAVATGLRATLGRRPRGTHEAVHAVMPSRPGT